MSAATMTVTPERLRLVAPVWWLAVLAGAGVAWVLGLEVAWWARLLVAVAGATAAGLDAAGTSAAGAVRVRAGVVLAALGGAQLPLAVAGGAWLLGMGAPVDGRLALAGVVVLVGSLLRAAPAATIPGGAR